MIKIGELEFYTTWMKDLNGHIVRVNGPSLGNNKKKMIVAFVPKEELAMLLGELCSFADDKTELCLSHQINDQFNTEIEITRYPESVSVSNRIYRVLIKSCQLVIRTDIAQDQLEKLIANMKVVVHSKNID